MNNQNFFITADADWHESGLVRTHEHHVAVKPISKESERKETIIIPSDKWYLNGPYEVFSYRNTVSATPWEEQSILDAFNQTEYRIGYCYDNTDRLCKNLRAKGIEAIPYVGWLFLSGDEYPIHHCWAVIRSEKGNHVLDLSDDSAMLLSYAEGRIKPDPSFTDWQDLLLQFVKEVKRKKIPNSVRCLPVGQVFSRWLYVGSPCSPEKGRIIYNQLVRKYPHHECQMRVKGTMTETQKLLKANGLMKTDK